MYDGITAADVPAGAAIYAGYVDGAWASYDALAAEYPGALHVSIAVTASGDARVLDVENGDATPAQAPGWAEDQRRAGNPYPVVYMNETTWPAVQAQFAAQAVTPALYWVAAYVDDPANVPEIPVGAIAVQYFDHGGYDVSVVAGYWPGLDPAPITAAAAALEEDEMAPQIEPLSVHPTEYSYALPAGRTELVLVADGYGNPAASLRVAFWAGNGVDVLDPVNVGGVSGMHTVGHTLPTGCTGVTVRRLDGQDYPVGIAFK
jgi:hypothetical protein